MKVTNLKSNDWPAVVLILGLVLGCIGTGAWLVVEGHEAGWWLIVVPLLAVFLI